MQSVEWKTGYATMWNAQSSSNDKCKLSYMNSWLILQSKSSASTMQMQDAMHNDNQIFLDFLK